MANADIWLQNQQPKVVAPLKNDAYYANLVKAADSRAQLDGLIKSGGSNADIQTKASERQSYLNASGNTALPTSQDYLSKQGYTPTAQNTGVNNIQPPPQAYQQPRIDYSAQFNQLANLQKQKAAADLNSKYNSSLSGINAEQATIAPQYNQDRNVMDTQKQINVKNFGEYLSATGRNNAVGSNGTNDQYRTSSDIANMQGLSGLYQQEQAANNDIARRKSDLNTGLQTDLASANMGIDATSLQNIIDTQQQQQARQDQLNQFDKTYGLNLAGLTGNINGQQTLSSQNQSFNQNMQAKQYNANQTQQQWDNAYKTGQFDYQKQRDNVNDTNYSKEWNQKLDEYAWSKSQDNPQVKGQILDNQVKSLELQNLPEQQKLQLQQLKKQIAQIGAVQPTSDYEKTKQSIDLETMREQLYQLRTSSNTTKPTDYKTDPNFQSEISDIASGSATIADVTTHSKELQAAYGYDGYLELVKAATPKE